MVQAVHLWSNVQEDPTAQLAEETLKFHFLKKGILSLPEGQTQLSHVTESKIQKTEGIDAYRSKTLRSFNSFLKRVSKLDTTASLTVQLFTMLEIKKQQHTNYSQALDFKIITRNTITDKGEYLMNMTSSIFEKEHCFRSSSWKMPCITICIVLIKATIRTSERMVQNKFMVRSINPALISKCCFFYLLIKVPS